MAYRFRRKESAATGVTRIVGDELDGAIRRLEHTGARFEGEAVHESRKSVKKARAILRLIRPKLHGRYARADRRLQKVGRALSAVRDADVLVDTFDALRARYPARLRGSAFAALRRALVDASAEARNEAVRSVHVRDVARQLRATRGQTDRWHPHGTQFRALTDGLQTSFRRARRTLDDAERERTDELFHTWRKRVKTHWYHARLLERIERRSMTSYIARLKRLETLLGDDHNLAVLEDRLASLPALRSMTDQRAIVVALIGRFHSDLRKQAVSLGHQIYAPRPRVFVRRVRKAWRSWRHHRTLQRRLDLTRR